MGRTDDMMKIKGVNVFPAQIEEILKEFPEVSSEYQIRISHLEGKDTMRIYVETNGTVDFLDLAKRIASKVKSRIGFTPLAGYFKKRRISFNDVFLFILYCFRL